MKKIKKAIHLPKWAIYNISIYVYQNKQRQRLEAKVRNNPCGRLQDASDIVFFFGIETIYTHCL